MSPVGVLPSDWLRPRGLPDAVGGVMTTRRGGTSAPPWASMNLGDAVGDDPAAVQRNRQRLAAHIGATPVFLRQVHGTRVVTVGADDVAPDVEPPVADASVTVEPGVACTVLVADCLPLLFAAPDGRAVAAAHAGWRGLAAGVVEATLEALCAAAHCRPDEVSVWLGASIGPRRFEVGADVLRAFGAEPAAVDGLRFRPQGAGSPGKWLADLPQLARDRLRQSGVHAVEGDGACTVEDGSRFFSYRRDGVCGRMAAAVWIRR